MAAYRSNAGPDSQLDAQSATVVGDWQESSEESQIKLGAAWARRGRRSAIVSKETGRGFARGAEIYVFAFGLAIYLFVQIGLVLGPIVMRSLPPVPTDSYVYISKARQLTSCIRSDCPALTDLRRQVAPDDRSPSALAMRRSLSYQRVIYQYHLLHSAILVGLNAAGIAWEDAIDAVSVMGALVIAGAVAWLLYAAFGAGPAGFALGFLGFAVYPGYHGLHWVVPGNIALGIGFAAWAAVLARPRWLSWGLPLLVLAMTWMHPVGRIYGLAALVLHAALILRRDRRLWPVLALGVLALASPSLAALVVERPALFFQGLRGGEDRSLLEGLTGNLTVAGKSLVAWLLERGGIAVVVLGVAGVIAVERVRAAKILALIALTGALLAGSLLYVLPHYPGELFHRLFIPFVVAVSGAAGYAIWRLGLSIADGGGVFAQPRAKPRTERARRQIRLWSAGLLFLVATAATVGSVAGGSKAVLQKARAMTLGGLMPLDLGQPARILAQVRPGERLVYMNELPLFFYLSHGGLKRGTVYAPAVVGSPRAARYLNAKARLRFAVRGVGGLLYGGHFPLRTGRPLVLRSPQPIDWSLTRISLETRGRPLKLRIRVAGGGPARRIEVPAGGSGWRALGLEAGAEGRALVIVRVGPGPLAWIQGWRVEPDQRLFWPWGRGLRVDLWKVVTDMDTALAPGTAGAAKTAANKITVRRFELKDLVPAGCRNLGVVEDFGAVVVSRVACGKP